MSMLALILISLIVIGGTTFYFFSNENEEYHLARLERKENTIIESLQYFFEDFHVDENTDVVSLEFEKEIKFLADVNKVVLNIFNTKGEILMSSNFNYDDPEFFEKKINNKILNEIKGSKERKVFEEGENSISAYAYIFDREGKQIAIANIPYNKENMPVKDDIGPFLNTLLKIYVFLLIGASFIAFLLSNYITKSMVTIADKMKVVNITQKNAPLEWKANDEIGMLVREYNSMIKELEISAQKLAKNERELAWREMAKQVAHEIKNPLTPMKLSVQHLARALKANDPDYEEKLSRFSSKMIQQIDTLTSIANEFSNFAKMPKAKMKTTDLMTSLKSTIELFKETKGITLNFNSDIESASINGDSEQLTRVFNNVIKNAIQSIPDDKSGIISINIKEEEHSFLIEVKDNGSGISDDLIEKIFVPNFTTKSNGTGLGLAMVKKIIETHNGEIDFKTVFGVGTTFYIKLPKQ
jgi:nitrogen fixation/metabolism regulation signal transduction histidine kinase